MGSEWGGSTGAQYLGETNLDVPENGAGTGLGKAPEMELRLEGAGYGGNYQSGERSGQREQKCSQLGEE